MGAVVPTLNQDVHRFLRLSSGGNSTPGIADFIPQTSRSTSDRDGQPSPSLGVYRLRRVHRPGLPPGLLVYPARYVGLVCGYGALEGLGGVDETPAAQKDSELEDDVVGDVDACESHRPPQIFPDASEGQTRGCRRATSRLVRSRRHRSPAVDRGTSLDRAPACPSRTARDRGSAVAHRSRRARLASQRGRRDRPRARRRRAAGFSRPLLCARQRLPRAGGASLCSATTGAGRIVGGNWSPRWLDRPGFGGT